MTKSIYDVARAADTKRWPTTIGKIVASEVEETTGYGGATYYRPKVRYQYSIDGRGYENDAVRISRTNYFTNEPAAKIIARYPAGATVEMRCNPLDPSEAVLETSADNGRRNIRIGLILLALPFVAGAAIVWINSF